MYQNVVQRMWYSCLHSGHIQPLSSLTAAASRIFDPLYGQDKPPWRAISQPLRSIVGRSIGLVSFGDQQACAIAARQLA